MREGTLAVVALAGMFVLAALAPALGRLLGRGVGYLLAAAYVLAGIALAWEGPAVLGGGRIVFSAAWVPGLDVRFTLVVDGLSLLFGLLVLLVGAVVMAYTARYVGPHGSYGGLFFLLTLFAGSMLGLVLAGDVVLLFVFWELTSIVSYLLIGGRGDEVAKASATRALLVTGVGGLALFAGLLLAVSVTGTSDLGEILARADRVAAGSTGAVILALLAVGAFTKSAQFPFHFWLPGAMVAPTPVSTYLHAATMVKAGVYLLARCAPLFAGREIWMELTVLVGLMTAVIGAGIALRQYDLKMLLAYSTVSSLGMLTALVGVGTFRSLAAASVYVIAHALFKATLFMVVGILDREAGSRDIRTLSGLRKAMPITAAVTGLAALSMAGVPPFLGFVAKEEIFGALLEGPGGSWFVGLAATLALAASAMTFAYSARIFHGAFGGPLTQNLYEPARSFLAPAAVTAAFGFLLGIGPSTLDPLVGSAAEAATGRSGAVGLALWHGFKPPLALSAVAIAGGVLLFASRHRLDRVIEAMRPPVTGAAVFDRSYEGTLALGRAAAAPFLSDAPAVHLGWILGTCATAGLAAWLAWSPQVGAVVAGSAALDWVAVGLIGAAAIGIARARSRIGAVALTGIVGFLVAVVYLSYGGPDLAMTQLAVETLTVAILVLVFRRLPSTFVQVARSRRRMAAFGGLAIGLLAGAAAYTLTGRRPLSEAGAYFLRAGPAEAGGRNVVNTILVDFRALDTLGETTVLAVAAIGIVVLVGVAGGRR